MHRYVCRQSSKVQFVANVQALLQIYYLKKDPESSSAVQNNVTRKS